PFPRRPGPFVGPRPFDVHEQGMFFGRRDAAEEVARLWRANRLTVLHGDAGTGKTSLLRAGLVPALRAEGANVLPPGESTAADPVAALPRVNPYLLTLLRSWAPEESPARLAATSLAGFLRCRERADRRGAAQPTLAAIDQVERITRGDGPLHRHRRLFLEELCAALLQRPRTHLLVVVRTDQLDAVLRVAKQLDEVEYAQFALGPLPAGAAREVVRGSLREAGRRFDVPWTPDLLERLGGGGDVDPVLLQVVCARLWSSPEPPAGSELPAEVRRALRAFGERVLADVAADHDVDRSDLAGWLRRPEDEDRGAVTEAVRHALEDRYLLTRGAEDRARPYRLRHPLLDDALRPSDPDRWPRAAPTAESVLTAAAGAFATGDLGQAERLALGAAKLPAALPRTPAETETLLGGIAVLRRRPGDAKQHYEAASGLFDRVRDQSRAVLLLAARGWVALDAGDPHEAVRWLEHAIHRDPNNPAVQTWLGIALKQAGMRTQAVSLLDKAVRRADDPLVPQRALAATLADSDDRTFAERALREYSQIRSGPFAPSDEATRALAQATIGDAEAARRGVRAAVARDPRSGAVLLTGARALLRLGEPERAAGLARQALSADDPPLPPHQRPDAERVMEMADQRRGRRWRRP
ncbi:nSTAND1 domain-containing NTPase, partial [Actinomadura kijaniata]|uniref:tetratricopeptide repeat protein n=1 Tax=Actinomadura kijaniata TaxID=46161 RepID=UPI003F1D1780